MPIFAYREVYTMNYDFKLLNIGHSHHQGDWNYERVCSPFSRIYWVTEGRGEVTFVGQTHELRPGHLCLIPSFTTHNVHCDGAFGHYYLHFLDASRQVFDLYHQNQFPLIIPATEVDERIVRHLTRLAPELALKNKDPRNYETSTRILQGIKDFQQRPVARQMEISGLLQILLSHFFAQARPRTVSDKRILQALWVVNNDLAHVPSLDRLADEACMTKDSFIRLFRRQTGTTPTDYIIRRRITQAQLLLVSERRSVKQVAAMVGYENVSYFGRTFRRITGMSPMEFVRQNR
ncbi:MAG: helix-turn-helix domain-containing protein [Bacteroidaceae bacterium]|nr:helix-turn-helix domain-containing protein [Bacteroidaceae bacterium]